MEGDHLEALGIDGGIIIIKYTFKEWKGWGERSMDWINT
jgi:hypothetical protein